MYPPALAPVLDRSGPGFYPIPPRAREDRVSHASVRTVGSGDQHQNAMLMIRLARFCTLQHDSAWYSAGYGPKLDPSLGVLIA